LKFYKKLKEYFDVFVIKKYFGKTQYTVLPNIRVLQSEKASDKLRNCCQKGTHIEQVEANSMLFFHQSMIAEPTM